ncbi:MAG: hypothetical protein M1827_005361 [Pycnora praestabilis]|nr:MAG: hypothetical protein M1827_005361 [Pycnora praestabilis]
MAAAGLNSSRPKASFAQVAASFPSGHIKQQTETASGESSYELVEPPSAAGTSFSSVLREAKHPVINQGSIGQPGIDEILAPKYAAGLHDAVKALDIKEDAINSTLKSSSRPNHLSTMADMGFISGENQTQLSASDLLAKPPSLDGKSVASGTTFALDEKESLRPDDSASVKAGDEDDSFSGPGSRVGSEAGARAFRDQFSEISERTGPSPQRGTIAARFSIPLIQPTVPDLSCTRQLPICPNQPSLPGQETFKGTGAPYGFSLQGPDEKLLEALESPKDRLFLLRLEQDVIDFVKNSKESTLDLPPCNSFYRLLAHKLADYYYLTHFVDNAVNAVRLYRTPPPPLTGISNLPTSGNTPPPSSAFKIMQRGGQSKEKRNVNSEGNTVVSSGGPSKSTSEIGIDSGSDEGPDFVKSPNGSSSAKDRAALTREEREAKYKEARERIFKGFEGSEDGDAANGTEDQIDMSRSSSTAGKKKSKKTRNAYDDGFEARSQFNAYYPNVQYPMINIPSGPTGGQFFNSYPASSSSASGQAMSMNFPEPQQQLGGGFHSRAHPDATTEYKYNPQQYFQPDPCASNTQGFSQPPRTNNGQSSQAGTLPFSQQNLMPLQPTASLPAAGSYGQYPQPYAQDPSQQWPQSSYQNPYQAYGPPPPETRPQSMDRQSVSNQGNLPSPNPYPYGHLPTQGFSFNGHQYQNQHPLPGSYNRQTFNPQTQSFVPKNGFNLSQAGPYGTQPQVGGLGSLPTVPFVGNQMPFTTHRQTSSSTHSGYSSPQLTQASISKQTLNGQPYPYAGSQPPLNQPTSQSSLSKWGTPSHLPPKPPPTQMPPFIENLRSLPSQGYSAPGRTSLPTSGRQSTSGSAYGPPSSSIGGGLPPLSPGVKLGQQLQSGKG